MHFPKNFVCATLVGLTAVTACGDSSGPTEAQKAVSPDLSTLTVGKTRTLTLAQLPNGLIVPKGGSGATYLVTVTNLSVVDTGTIPQYAASGDVVTDGPALRASLQPSRAPVTSWSTFPVLRRNVGGVRRATGLAGMRAEARFRDFTRRDIAPVFRRAVQHRIARSLSPARRQTVNPPAVGDKLALRTPVNGCDTPLATTTAYVKAVSNRAIVLSDSASPANGFTDSDFQNIASEFDQLTYATVTSNFGAPTDFDDNGRVMIYFTPFINSLSTTDPSQGFVGGAFFLGDLLDPTDCPESNDGEIFYLVTPDPTGSITQPFTREDVIDGAFGTMAHEFVHMINAGHKILDPNATTTEAPWLDEGLAHMSEHVVGRAAIGATGNTVLDVNTLANVSDSLWYAYFSENFGRAYFYLLRPDTTGAIVNENRIESSLAARGAIWSLLQFAEDQYANGNRSAFTQALTLSSDTGIVNLLARVGVPLDTLLTHWHAALTAESQTITGLNGAFGYNSYEWGDIFTHLTGGPFDSPTYPLTITLVDGSSTLPSIGVPGSSAASFRIVQSSSKARHVRFTKSGGTTLDPNIRVTITRVH